MRAVSSGKMVGDCLKAQLLAEKIELCILQPEVQILKTKPMVIHLPM